jgi:hypothetical protein
MAGISLSFCGKKVLSLESNRNLIIEVLDFLVNRF